MKKRYILLVVSCMMSVGMASCDRWLNINPEFEIVEETLFEKAQGYYASLTGLYVHLASTSLYGQELTWGAVEAWGRGYQVNQSNNKAYYFLGRSDYQAKEVKDLSASIWLNCFNVIAGANNLIQNLENDEQVMFPDGALAKNMILGEAYAIRSLMHFEIVRIFAQAPLLDQGGVTAYVPFIDKFPSKINVPIPTKEVLGHIISDLEKAKELLRPFDTESPNAGWQCYQGTLGDRICQDSESSSGAVNENFLGYRANRMGYYPITQLLARVALYAGDKDKAYENANEIVTMVNDRRPYMFLNPNYIGNPMDPAQSIIEPRLHSEMLYGIYNYKLKEITKPYFDLAIDGGVKALRLPESVWMYLFASNASDRRGIAIPGDICTKYTLNGVGSVQMKYAQSLVSVLRFPECFYIAAESLFDKDSNHAIEIFNSMVEARNNSVYKLDAGISKNDFIAALVKEYQREFLSEGVMTYVYKRLDYPVFQNGTMVKLEGKLVMPLPDTEAGIY